MTFSNTLDPKQEQAKLLEHREQQHHQQCRLSPDIKVPLEVWEEIFLYLYPSQLSRMSMVSKTLAGMIISLELWFRLFNLTHDAHVRLRLLKGIPESKSYMLYMCATSLHVCERCFRLVPFGVKNSSQLPLPVLVPLRGRSTNEIKYVGERLNLTWTVNFCLDCRQSHFSEFEERQPRRSEYAVGKIPTSEHWKKYPTVGQVPALQSQAYWYEWEVVHHMRIHFGGTVGIKASTVPVYEFDEKTDKRIEWYQLQD